MSEQLCESTKRRARIGELGFQKIEKIIFGGNALGPSRTVHCLRINDLGRNGLPFASRLEITINRDLTRRRRTVRDVPIANDLSCQASIVAITQTICAGNWMMWRNGPNLRAVYLRSAAAVISLTRVVGGDRP